MYLQNKIRSLEDKLRDEKRQRKQMQEKAAELETAAQTQRILQEAGASKPAPRRVKKKKKRSLRKPTVSTAAKHHALSTDEQNEHFRLNLADIPFIAGTVRL